MASPAASTTCAGRSPLARSRSRLAPTTRAAGKGVASANHRYSIATQPSAATTASVISAGGCARNRPGSRRHSISQTKKPASIVALSAPRRDWRNAWKTAPAASR